MKAIRFVIGFLVLAALGTGGWILIRHPEWVKGAGEEDEDAGEPMWEVPVRMGKISRATVRRYVEGFGTVEARPAASARVASPVAGILAEALCVQEQKVDRGTALFQLDERAAKAEEEKAAAASRTQRSLLRIQAPLAGTIVRVKVNPGEAVALATVLAEIVDLDRIVVEGSIPAADLRSVAAGMEVDLGTVRGKVEFVGLDVDRKNDGGFVRVSLPANSGFAVGRFVRLRIVVEEHKDHLVVPRQSVVTDPD